MASLTHPSIRSTFAFATFACIELPRNSALRMTFTFTLAAHLGFQVGQEVCQLRSFWCVRGIYLLADASGCYVCLMSTLDISQPFLGKTNVDQNAHAMLGLQSPNALKDVMAVFVGLQSALHVVLALLRSGDAVHQHMSCGAVHLVLYCIALFTLQGSRGQAGDQATRICQLLFEVGDALGKTGGSDRCSLELLNLESNIVESCLNPVTKTMFKGVNGILLCSSNASLNVSLELSTKRCSNV
mmetsp:Transcript_132957/g.242109  ORF Transcript_132957/g.242109 Transcript_132957/m.242109 type:complete len:242 (-) Transcript_132957:41-766(-)